MFQPSNVLSLLFTFGLIFNLSAGISSAQTTPGSGANPTPAETLHTRAELVIVDVVVQDRDGHPYHGLTRDAFEVTEQKKPQTVRSFEEHTATTQQKPGPSLPLGPGEFSDYTPVPPGRTLNVLLIDTLNTPVTGQNYLRLELLNYLKTAKPGTQVAIFGLATRLFMLQGFTSDPAILRAVAEHAFPSRGSPLLKDPVGAGAEQEDLAKEMEDSGLADSDPGFAAALARLEQWEAEREVFKTELRTKYTLDAFNGLARYLSGFPGRKNLIWFSGSFPLGVLPDSAIENPLFATEYSGTEFKETTSLLARAQVAVYPIDARGLMPSSLFEAADKGRSQYARHPTEFAHDVAAFDESQALEHSTMAQMASDTGGEAFYNTNGLSEAMAKAIDAGSNYYTLAYTPTNHDHNGKYRDIRVKLVGVPGGSDLHLSYRRGYYADESGHRVKHDESTAEAGSTSAESDDGASAYLRAAISHGAPTAQDILFKIRAVPLTGKSEETVAPGNRADSSDRMKAPYQTYAIDYVALPSSIQLALQPDGTREGAVEFTVVVFDAEGHRLNLSDKEVALDLQPETYKRFLANPIRFQLRVSAPVKQQSYLRIILRDVPNNRYGVVEIPTAQIAHLPPLEAQAAPAGAAKPGATAPPQRATKQ